MAISEGEWSSIREVAAQIAEQVSGGRRNYFTARVIKRDEANGLVWVKELDLQPIPVVGHSYEVKYYDTDSTGVVTPKTVTVKTSVPKVGDNIFIVLEMGAQSLPRCLGTIYGKNWLMSEEGMGFSS